MRIPSSVSCAFFIVVVAALTLVAPGTAAAMQAVDEPPAPGLVRLAEVEGGALLLATAEPGWYVLAPTVATDIDVTVSGPIARTIVTQRFRNVAEVFVEGTYLFPLPDGSAVDTLRMRVGDRWIEGILEEREEAREIYEEAKAAGQVASLVEQQRPNAFTTSVANIAPGDEVIVQIEFQQHLAPRDGVFGLRIPLVVAPRYVPAEDRVPQLALSRDGWVIDDTASSVMSPVLDPRDGPSTGISNPVDITIDLDAGFPLSEVESPYHDVAFNPVGATRARVDLGGTVPADRDFYLSWRADELDEPFAATFVEDHGDEIHYLAMLTPPSLEAIESARVPRDVIFVQDTSGSMGGESLAQAKAGLITALQRLEPDDSFNVVEFNSRFSTFADESMPATAEHIAGAIAWVNSLTATGGTEMRPALEWALQFSGDPEDGKLRQIVFLTDGAVTNEYTLLQLIERRLGDARLFTVGIGSAPNSYFMTAAARSGRGSFVFIGDLAEVDERMQDLFAKIESPAALDLTVRGLDEDSGVEITPWPIPDLYAGDPVVLTVRVSEGGTAPDELRLAGRRGDEPWRTVVDLVAAEQRTGIAKLWAREQIEALEHSRTSTDRFLDIEEVEKIDAAVLDLALEFGLVTRLTSLVAVDLEITRPADEDAASTQVPTNLPAGWDPEIFFADAASATTADELSDELANVLAGEPVDAQGGGVPLPATGANWHLQAMLGAALAAIGGGVLVRGRRVEQEAAE